MTTCMNESREENYFSLSPWTYLQQANGGSRMPIKPSSDVISVGVGTVFKKSLSLSGCAWQVLQIPQFVDAAFA